MSKMKYDIQNMKVGQIYENINGERIQILHIIGEGKDGHVIVKKCGTNEIADFSVDGDIYVKDHIDDIEIIDFGWKLVKDHQHKFKVITLCGSTKFKDEFIKMYKELSAEGYIVLSVGGFGHAGDDWIYTTEGMKEMLDEMHYQKINISDAIYVINKDGYIGESTAKEIEYAKFVGKDILYFQ